MDTLNLIAFFVVGASAIFLLYAFIQTILEKEGRAAKRLGILASLMLVFLLALLLWPDQNTRNIVLIIAAGLIVVSLFILIFPWPSRMWDWERGKPDRIDERNIMFSRAELIPDTEKYNAYYKEFPNHREPDDKFRKMPGLLSEESTYYRPWIFGAADATFFTVESLHSKTDGDINKTAAKQDPAGVSRFLKVWAKEMGCHSIGFTTLQAHHLYTIGGRKHNYGEPVKNDHKYAIAFTVEMDFDRIKAAPRGPVIMESSAQYLRAGVIAVQLAAFIRGLGFSAQGHIYVKDHVRCLEVAKDAGLGELGRMSILMTPDLGPRVRIGVVTTDFPLILTEIKRDFSMLKFCRICKKCAETCPAQAISYTDPELTGGTKQWKINQEACFTLWCKTGTDCGRCISVCPYSHPDNFLHKSVRLLIKTSPLFLHFAARMDNWLYGKKPSEKSLPEWMISS